MGKYIQFYKKDMTIPVIKGVKYKISYEDVHYYYIGKDIKIDKSLENKFYVVKDIIT